MEDFPNIFTYITGEKVDRGPNEDVGIEGNSD